MYYTPDGDRARIQDVVEFLMTRLDQLENHLSDQAAGLTNNTLEAMIVDLENKVNQLERDNHELQEKINKLEFLIGDN